MTYYRVKLRYDNKLLLDGSRLVGTALYTAKEIRLHDIPSAMVDTVKIPRRRVYWLSGARFEIDT